MTEPATCCHCRRRRSRITQRLNESRSEIGSIEGAFPFAKIYCTGERPHEMRFVPPCLFARCGLAAERRVSARQGWAGEKSGLFEHPEAILTSAS